MALERGRAGSAAREEGAPAELSVCVVGAGPRFLSGISYYTNRLVNALAARHRVSTLLIRQMLPTRLYPGRDRVGKSLTNFTYPVGSPVFDGIDWYWGLTLVRALGFLRRQRPEVVVLQWWTGTVLHTYLALAIAARLLRAKVVIEFHEVLDTAELNIAPVRWYVTSCAPWLLALSHGYVVHNEFDRAALAAHYHLGERPTKIIPHGPYNQYGSNSGPARADDGVCRLLYLGVIRPFKGVEDIVDALDLMDDEQAARFHLTVVGETWEGWTLPAEKIAASRHAERITFVNRYVADEEVGDYFGAADAVVLPYHRSSSSGPLHLAMAFGLPVVVSAVGGLIEATEGYEGAIRVPPNDPQAIRAALDRAWSMRGQRFADVHSWERTIAGYDELFAELGLTADGPRSPAPR